MTMTPEQTRDDPAFLRHYAAVCETEASRSRWPEFAAWLRTAASKARTEAEGARDLLQWGADSKTEGTE